MIQPFVSQSTLVIVDNYDGTFYVCFNLNGVLIKGNIPEYNMPHDYEKLFPEDFMTCYRFWEEIINGNKTEELIKKNYESDLVKKAKQCSLLTFKDGLFYRNNLSVSLPEELINDYITSQSDPFRIEGLDNFWFWTAQLPHEQKEMLYNWVSKNNLTLTQDGMIVVYRNVIKAVNQYTENVYSSYYTIKARKKNVKNYSVDMRGNLSSTGDNLLEAYIECNNMYTHDYGATKRIYYYIGKEASLDRSKVDFTNKTCSEGLKCVVSF